MRTIILTESQVNRLFEASGDSEIFNGSNGIASPGNNAISSVNATIITDRDGEEELQGNTPYAEPVTGNKFAKQQSPQQWAVVGARNTQNSL